jgi:hypothetical protein
MRGKERVELNYTDNSIGKISNICGTVCPVRRIGEKERQKRVKGFFKNAGSSILKIVSGAGI